MDDQGQWTVAKYLNAIGKTTRKGDLYENGHSMGLQKPPNQNGRSV